MTFSKFAALALIVLPSCAVYAQSAGAPTAAQAPYTIQSSARLVVLDVVVTDRQGNVVPNLRREDFHISEGGEPQTIVNFEGIGAHAVAANVTVDSTADLERMAPQAPVNIIVLDEYNTLFKDMAYGRAQLKSYLESQPEKMQSPTELIAISLSKYQVLQDFTQNRAELLNALDHHVSSIPWQAEGMRWQPERYIRTFDSLQKVALATTVHQGHKNVLWVGAGLARLSSDTNGDTRRQLDNIVSKCVNMLRDARVTLYYISPSGNPFTTYKTGQTQMGEATRQNPGRANGGVSMDAVDPFQGSLDFARMAEATGGVAMRGRNDVDVLLATGVRDGGSLYTLSYRPTQDTAANAKFRKIRITMDAPGLTARTREGYYPKDNPSRTVQDLIVALQSEATYSDVPVTAAVAANSPDHYMLNIVGSDLNWTADAATGVRYSDILVLGSTFDAGGKELKRVAKTFRIKQPITAGESFHVDFPLDHSAGAARTRFVVRVDKTGQVGSADVALKQGPA